MSEEIKKIAALIGHQQAQKKHVAALIDQFQAESAQLIHQISKLAQVIRELDSASGNITETAKKSVSTALNHVEQELKHAGLVQQKPAVNVLSLVVKADNESVYAMRREMSCYTWKSATYIVLTIFLVMEGCLWNIYYFIESGYGRISEIQRIKTVWEQKVPLLNLSTCDRKTCI